MNYLHIQTRHGLANRLRALVSGMWMAERTGVALVLGWSRGHGLGCRFEDLFVNAIDQDTSKLEGRETIRYRNPRHIDPSAYDNHEVLTLDTCQPFSHDPAVIVYSNEFWTAVRPYLSSLVPVEQVRRRVDAVAGRFDDSVLGVHFRWDGEHFKYTTPDMFFPEIDSVLQRDSGMRIYLATDSITSIERFRERYGDTVMTVDGDAPPLSRGRDDIEGARTALADLILLSRTQKMLGTFFSSFTELAGVLGAIPFKSVGSYGTMPDEPREFSTRVRRSEGAR